MVFVTRALELGPSTIAGEESALGGGKREGQAAKSEAPGATQTQPTAQESARMAAKRTPLVGPFKFDEGIAAPRQRKSF
jgi:hypothetical protein